MSQKTTKEGPRLSKNQKFSEHFSIHCCPPFTFLNSKREIVDRKYSICKSGCFYQKKEEDWICCACQKTSISCTKSSPAHQKPGGPTYGLFMKTTGTALQQALGNQGKKGPPWG
ncbi:myelin associated oligodendrocyte basic protein [Rhinolophus ferrumequinum]|uniref:Myelin associated oligodendrocyte basic protein n=1 Tax=Rhinolophus ferrumequinum TaxID=59479 RepID=A0A7J7UJU5_RHIFE|nr:myelin associated oligodendrocyte basic protein [Rhinolophus ferrumequinum]